MRSGGFRIHMSLSDSSVSLSSFHKIYTLLKIIDFSLAQSLNIYSVGFALVYDELLISYFE